MDNLAKCMIQCKADGYGVHYGAWRAAQGGVFLMKEDTIPAGWKKCEYCGELYKPSRSDQKFCGATCQRLKAEQRFREKRKTNGKAKNVGLLQACCAEQQSGSEKEQALCGRT